MSSSTLAIDHGESKEALVGDEACNKSQEKQKNRSNWLVYTGLNFVLFLTSIVILIKSHSTTPINAALRSTSTYSPVLEDFSLPLQTTQLNSSLFGEIPSIWRGLPDNPITEAAWDSFEHIRTLPLTSAQILQMGKNPATVAKFEDPIWHMGDDRYVGALDFFHQVHCLNVVRKAAFYNHPASTSTRQADEGRLYWVHLQHCVDMLMQHLLCTADTGMITYQWKEENEHPFPDFGVQRECKDWRRLVEYRDAKAVNLEKYMGYVKPEWVEEVPQPEEYWELMRELERDGMVGHEHVH